jgi:hypothetical protein
MKVDNKPKKWSCINCRNFREKVVSRKDIEGISKRVFQRAIKEHDYNRLNLKFPLTNGIFRKIRKFGKIKILFCLHGKFKRSAYEYKGKPELSSVTSRKGKCPNYDK